MIMDLATLETLQIEWNGVHHMRERVRHLAIRAFAWDPMKSPVFGDVLYNLPLGMAYDVLKQVLLIAREERQFTSSKLRLGDLMDSAKSALSWIDWECLRDGVRLRDESRQVGKLFGDIECLQQIADIESQLVAWDIITVTATSRTQAVRFLL